MAVRCGRDSWLDAYNNGVPLGHARPDVVEAIARQAAVLNTHTRYLHEGGTGFTVARFAYHGVTSAIACASPSLGHYVRIGDHVPPGRSASGR